MMIDFHTHTFPERIAEMAVDKMKKACGCRVYRDGTRDSLIASMRRSGIDHSVVLPVVTNPVKAASMNNLSMELDGKDGIIYFGGIHPDTPDAQKELCRIAGEGLKGIKIHPLYQDAYIDDPRYLRILSKAGELGLIVVMHAGDDIGFPGVVRCTPAMIRRALAQAGPVQLVCAHMGGWQNWDSVADQLADTSAMIDTALALGQLTPLEPGAALKEEHILMEKEKMCAIIRAFGSRRVLFGSDSPWADQRAAAEGIDSLDLTQEEKRDIFCGNAMRLLGMEKREG